MNLRQHFKGPYFLATHQIVSGKILGGFVHRRASRKKGQKRIYRWWEADDDFCGAIRTR